MKQKRIRRNILAVAVVTLALPHVALAQRAPRTSESSPSSPSSSSDSSSSSSSWGSGSSSSSSSGSSWGSGSSSSSSSDSSGSSGSSSGSSGWSSGSSSSSDSSYSRPSRSSGSSPSMPSSSMPSRSSTPIITGRERPGNVTSVSESSNSGSSSASSGTPASSGNSSNGSSSGGSTAVRPPRIGASVPGSVSTTPRRTTSTGIVPSNPNAPADARVARNAQRPTRPVATTAVKPETAPTRTVALRNRVYRTTDDMTRDKRGNYVTAMHTRRMAIASSQMEVTRAHAKSRKFVEKLQTAYRKVQRPDAYRRYSEHRDLWQSRPPRWTRWYELGLYGGYYWDLGEFCEVDVDFYDPILAYYFTDQWNEDLYETWFEIDNGGKLFYKKKFPYAGVFLPTVSMIELLKSVSAMSLEQQYYFKSALQFVVKYMAEDLKAIFGKNFAFTKNDIVISHFRLKEGKAVLLEGTVGKGLDQYPFKALIKIDGTDGSGYFIATQEDPSLNPTRIYLQSLNEKIDKIFNDDLTDETLIPIDYGIDEQP